MKYFKFLISFFVEGLFSHPDEYNINSQRFNVVKVLFVLAFFFFVGATMFLGLKFYDLGKRHIQLLEEHLSVSMELKTLLDRKQDAVACLKNQYLTPSDVSNLPYLYRYPRIFPIKEQRNASNVEPTDFRDFFVERSLTTK